MKAGQSQFNQLKALKGELEKMISFLKAAKSITQQVIDSAEIVDDNADELFAFVDRFRGTE
jgi:hypothetical protein